MYTYFAAALMGAQWVQPSSSKDYVDITNLPAFDKNNDTAANGDDDLPYDVRERRSSLTKGTHNDLLQPGGANLRLIQY